MVPLAAILYLALSFDYVYGYHSGIYWPKKFHLVGDYMNLLHGSSQPFEIWYNDYINRSRIDVDSGTVKRYYSYETHTVGRKTVPLFVLYKVYPKSDEDGYSKMFCKVKPYEQTVKQSISDYLPLMNHFIHVGEEKHRGETVQVWKKAGVRHPFDAIKEEETMILRYNDKKANDVFPIRYTQKKYNWENGALIHHSIINYDTIETEVSLKDLTADKKLCGHGYNLDSILEYLHPDNHGHVDIAFHRYHEHHNKSYEINEYELRKEIFRENWKLVKDHNSKNLTYKLSMNEFADWTPSELEYLRGTRDEGVTEEGILPFPHTEAEIEDMAKDLPENYNMIIKGYISNVKYQDKCGSCWAFAATATVEGALARTYGKLLELSPQSMVDCAWQYSSFGCDGSISTDSWSLFKYIKDFGIPTTAEYGPYLHEDGICKINNMTNVFRIRDFVRVHPYNANALKVALYNYGPVYVGIYAPNDMTLYSEGVYYSNNKNCTSKSVKITNHAVTVVGYGVRSGESYWIVKNSWGEEWGQDGYILMSAKDDNCNLLTRPFYVIV